MMDEGGGLECITTKAYGREGMQLIQQRNNSNTKLREILSKSPSFGVTIFSNIFYFAVIL